LSYQGDRHDVKVYRGGTIIFDDVNEVTSFKIERTINEERAELSMRLENSKLTIDIMENDAIEVYLATSNQTLTKIFSGEIESVTKIREDGEPFLDLTAADWSKLLSEHKISLSYPSTTPVNEIVEGIVEDITSGTPPGPNDRWITVTNVEATIMTRTIDFIGMSMYEALKKLSDTTWNDFFVDPGKDLNWFPRGTRTNSVTLTEDDLDTYNLETRLDICNYAKVYGAPNKTYPDPWNISDWTESLADPDNGTWTPLYSHNTLSLSTTPRPKTGTYDVKVYSNTIPPGGYSQTDTNTYYFNRGFFDPAQYIILFEIVPPEGQTLSLDSVGAEYGEKTGLGSSNFWIDYKWGTGPWEGVSGCTHPIAGTWNICSHGVGDSGLVDQKMSIAFVLQTDVASTCKMRNLTFSYHYGGVVEQMGARYSLATSAQIDLTKKDSPRKIAFAIYPKIANYSVNAPTLKVTLRFTSGSSATYEAQYFGVGPGQWCVVDIPIGPGAEGEGWSDVPSGTLSAIEIDFAKEVSSADLADAIYINWLHLDEAKWYGEYMLDDADPDVIQYGRQVIEFSDETAYSDQDCAKRAEFYAKKYKVPLNYLTDVKVDYVGMEADLDPGDVVNFSLPEGTISMRILKIIWEWDDEILATLELDDDPIRGWEIA
jgi:hypothetical protein